MPDTTTLADQLTHAFTGALEEMFRPEVGHSCTGDLPALADDARVLATVAIRVMEEHEGQ
jgi:hypothetical protein